MQCHWLWARAVEPISRWDPSCTTETPDQLNSSPLPDPWPLRAALPFSASMSLNILGMLCKWDHAAFVRLWLAYFMEPVTLQVHPCCHKRWHFFLLEGRVLFSYTFNAHLDDSITYCPGQCCCVVPWELRHLLQILNSKFLCVYQEVGLSGHLTLLVLIFEKPPCFAWWLHHFTSLPTV